MLELKVYKINEDSILPKFATDGSACFDISSYLKRGDKVKYYDTQNKKQEAEVYTIEEENRLVLMPGCRYLVPTGLIYDIPVGYSIRLHPRSGLSFKVGLGLANMEGVIDYDYVDPTFVLLENRSMNVEYITDGMRICQGEMVEMLKYQISETTEKPVQKTDREGGLGHTGH